MSTESISERIRNLETAEPPPICQVETAAVSTPPTQPEIDGVFGFTATQATEGWIGAIWDNVASVLWLVVSANGAWKTISVSASSPVHNLLSATHPDTVAQTPSRGSVVCGNATPKWDELVLGGIAGSVLTRDATDVLWSTGALSFSGAFTLTIAASGTPALGGGSGAANRVAYWSDANTLASDSGLTVDAANNFYIVASSGGIGTSASSPRIVFNNISNVAVIFGGNFGVGVSPLAVAKSDIAQGLNGFAIVCGADVSLADGRTNATRKVSRVGCPHYTNAEEPLTTVFSDSDAAVSYVNIGGGTAYGNAAMNVRIYTAANTTTVTGTERAIFTDAGFFGLGTGSPDRLLHAETSDAVTNAITYTQRLTHSTSGTAAALYGVGLEHELEDSAGNPQVASEQATLWSVATSGSESPLYRVTTYPTGTAGPGYCGFWTYAAIAGTAITVIANGTGDVVECATFQYAVNAVTAGDVGGGMITLEPGDSFKIYSDGTDELTLAIAADGSVTVQRTAGADTFNVSLWGVWL